jgi:phospholipid/cholesterol/gamma-HCH transport system substrate-binding protein
MEKGGHYFIVGLFVTAAIFALIGFSIWLAGDHNKKDYDYYTLQFHESVGGLEEGAAVTYKGVRVGQVMKVYLLPTHIDIIEAKIGVEKSTPVRAHTEARLDMQGITGLVRINLDTDAGDTEPPPVPQGRKYPVLQAKGSQVMKAFADLPELLRHAKAIAEKLDQVLDPDTMTAARQAVQNVQNLTRDLNGLLAQGNVDNVSQLLNNLSVSSAQLPEMIARLNKAADSMESAAQQVDRVVTRNKGHIDRFASEGLPQITGFSKEAKDAATSLRGLADKLKENPSQVLYPPAAHGVEIPK